MLFFHHCFLDLMGRGNQTKQIRGTQEIRDSKYFLLCMIHPIMPHPKKVIGGGGTSLAHSALSYTISNIYIYIYIKYIFYTFYLQYFVLHILLLSSKILIFLFLFLFLLASSWLSLPFLFHLYLINVETNSLGKEIWLKPAPTHPILAPKKGCNTLDMTSTHLVHPYK